MHTHTLLCQINDISSNIINNTDLTGSQQNLKEQDINQEIGTPNIWQYKQNTSNIWQEHLYTVKPAIKVTFITCKPVFVGHPPLGLLISIGNVSHVDTDCLCQYTAGSYLYQTKIDYLTIILYKVYIYTYIITML